MQANPQAGDTLEGIMDWWLLEQRIEKGVDEVSAAITWLVANGYLLEKKVPGSKPLYEINATKHDEIIEFINNADGRNQ